MKSSALVFFAALMSYLMPVLGAFYYNCEEALILKTAVAQRVGAKHQQLVAQGLRPDQFQAGSTFGQVTYDMISAVEPSMNQSFRKHAPVVEVNRECGLTCAENGAEKVSYHHK
ncbi:unnamed protein product [Blumeria hordei]|uniref:Uncharacterized protein n=1 Tax=Blumeria hordei TaxID=2867405 RepID=A0A383V3K0_BLUHO|nr:unnamed protein product [Blumeria hordei]